jgi:hypothetical protein
MSLRASSCTLLACFLLWSFSCGGGGSSNPPPPPPPPPGTFTLSLNPTQITLAQSFTQSVQLHADSQNGFSGSISVTTAGLPSGVTVSPSTLTLIPGAYASLAFSAASSVTPGNAQVSITGISGTQQVGTTLGLSIIPMASPVPVPFTTTGGNIIKAFYDESRKLLFACNFGLNEIDVLSGNNLSVQARIPVAQPFGIDQMPDGKTLVVGTFTQSFYTLNEDTLATTRYLAPNLSEQSSTMVLLIPVAMANGKVLFLGKDIGAGGGDIFIYGGQAIVEWDSRSGQFSVPYYIPYLSLEIDNLKRSADHSWASFAADKLYIYSSSTDSFVSSADPVNSAPYGVRDVAVNPNGSQLAVVSAYSVTFYDGAFNSLGTVNLGPSAGKLFDHGNSQYSTDGSRLYWEMFGDQGGGSIVDVLDAINFAEMGSVGTNIGIALQSQPDLLYVNNEQQAFAALSGGIESLSVSTLRMGMPDMAGVGGPQPHAIPLNQSATITLGAGQSLLSVGMSVTFNGVLAPVESATSGSMVVQAPASSVAGPVNLVFTQPDGETLIAPQLFSYGATIAAPTSTLIPPIGNPVMGLFGFGLLNDASQPPSVTIGGQAASVTVPDYTLDEIFVQIPNGGAGPADIIVSGVNGTSTLKSAVTYVPSAKIIPASGALVQLLYDIHRSLLYALQNNQIQVFNPITLTWNAPLLPGGSRGVGYSSMAITPDGSQVLVLDSSANTLTVFNPDNPSQSVSTPLNPGNGAILENVVTTSTGKAFIASLYGSPIEFDLATNTYSTTNIFSSLPSRFVATADGDYVAGVNQNSGSGAINIWSRSGGASVQSLANDIVWVDVAVASGGNLYAAVAGDLSAAGIASAFFDSGLHFTNVTVYPDLAPPDQTFCTGVIFSASGLTMLSPLADSIDFFSTQTATLQGRLLMPELLPVGNLTSGAIALDPNEQTIYAISASGLTVATLPSAVDQVTPFPWPYVVKSSHSIPVGAAARSQHGGPTVKRNGCPVCQLLKLF